MNNKAHYITKITDFYKNNYTFQNKNKLEELLELSNVKSNRRQLDSHVSFCIQSVDTLFWLKYVKNPSSHRQVAENQSTLIGLSDHYGYSSI